ncbi:unnamed protein product [Urochloa decumbens]|uniref:Myb-like domain-containing protein n=1 Tax=Urochloa decumbens TaxID=240449 RepID=A0ABC9DBF4_9POAL
MSSDPNKQPFPPSFTNLLNSSMSSDPPDPNTQRHQNFHQPPYSLNYPPPNFHGHYPHGITNPFAGPSSFQQFPPTPTGYHGGLYQGNMGQYLQGMPGGFASNGPASPVASMAFLGTSGGSSSRGDESSPIASGATPMHPAPVVEIAEDSESSTDDGGNNGGRKLWSEEENLRLVSAWLKNSNDPIDGNGKPRDRYWKEVAAEYNKHAPKQQKRTAVQCKEHWNKNIPHINKFNGIYNDMKNTYASGQSEDQLMEKVRAKWKSVMKKKRPFPLEHWWIQVKDQPKWARTYSLEEMQKRIKLNSAGAYSSSTQGTDSADVAETSRPQGRDAAKSERKNKGKRSEGSSTRFTNESMHTFNELQLRKTVVAEKMADAAIAQAVADKEKAEAEKDRAKVDKIAKYLQLLEKDTSCYDAVSLARHNQFVAYLAKELGM